MKIQFSPIAIAAIASLTLLARSAEIPAPNAPASATAPVQLSSGAADILKLAHAKVNDDVTLAFIHSSGLRYDLTANEIVYLRSEGVSDQVLTTMLSQPAASAPAAPPSAAPTEDQFASAPQYANAATASPYVETVPSSTVYVAAAPAYYAFADPWPYWSCWYPYPYFSFGFYWGTWAYGCWNNSYCYNGYWNNGYCNNGYWNNYCHYGNPPPGTVNRPVPHGNVPPGVRTGRGAAAGTLAATGATRNSARPTSYWSNNGGRPTAAPTSANQRTSAVAPQIARPTSLGNSVNNRTASDRATASRSTTQLTRSGYSSSPANTRRSPASQQTSVRPAINQRATVAMRSPRVNAGSSAVQYRPSSQPAYRFATGPSASYQRSSSFRPSSTYRSGGNAAGFSRPSMSAYSSMSSSSGFRGGGFSGATSMSAGGGFARGGGGGGFARGGGGGGRSR